MENRIIGIFIIVTLTTWTYGYGQGNPYDGFSTFEAGQGARNVALGNSNGANTNQEFSAWSVNPAQINPSSWSNISLHSTFYVAGIRSFALMGLASRDTAWPIVLELSRTSFGENPRYDIEGHPMGTFNASVSQFSIGTRRQLAKQFYLGAALHYNWRAVDFYNSHVLHFSLGGTYEPNDQSSLGLSLTNLGYEIIPFETQRSALPLDLSLYWRRKLNHLPFTFFLRMQKLNLWNRMQFQNPFQSGDQNIDQPEDNASRIKDLTEEVLRHMVLGGEFALGNPANVWLRFSYDHWRNLQLGIPAIRSLEGVAVGFGIKIKVLRIDYTWNRLYYDGGSHQLSLSFKLFENDQRRKGF